VFCQVVKMCQQNKLLWWQGCTLRTSPFWTSRDTHSLFLILN